MTVIPSTDLETPMPPQSSVFILLGLCGVAACQAPRAPAPLRLIASDNAFEVPARVRGGLVTVRLVNQGHSWHEALIVALADSASVATYLDAAKAGSDFPAGASDVSGPGIVGPGDSSEVVLRLAPGRYAVVCWTDNHVKAGMIAALEVTGSSPPSPGAPAAETELGLLDFHFDLSQPLRAGRQVIQIANRGKRTHEVAVYRLAEGRTVADFGAWLATRDGAPPAWPVGGAASMESGRETWATLTLPPGHYFMACGVPEGDQIHAQLGMLEEFTIS
jgi:uncharacterized cupredoxin-like copper-binding protein